MLWKCKTNTALPNKIPGDPHTAEHNVELNSLTKLNKHAINKHKNKSVKSGQS